MDDAISKQHRHLKVALFSPSWPPDRSANGIVPYVSQVAAGLRRMGHEACILSAAGSGSFPDVYFLNQEPRPLLSRLTDPITFRIAPEDAQRRKIGRNLFIAAARAIADRGVQLLEIEETFGYLQLIRQRLRIPAVVRLHGPCFANAEAGGINHGSGFLRRVEQERVGITLADAISASSRAILELTRSYYGLPLEGAAVIHPPAPVVAAGDRWQLGSCDPARILFLGRFDRHKGGDVVIDCLRILSRKFPRVRLWFAGKEQQFRDDNGRYWPLAEYLEQRAPEAAGLVDELGFVPDSEIAALRRRAFLTIVASRFEVLSLASLEAMAYGCPLVATRTGGIAEIVDQGTNGLLCEPGDAADMATQIARLLDNPEFAARLGQRAAQDASERYHPDVVSRQAAEFYRAQIDRWNSGSRAIQC